MYRAQNMIQDKTFRLHIESIENEHKHFDSIQYANLIFLACLQKVSSLYGTEQINFWYILPR